MTPSTLRKFGLGRRDRTSVRVQVQAVVNAILIDEEQDGDLTSRRRGGRVNGLTINDFSVDIGRRCGTLITSCHSMPNNKWIPVWLYHGKLAIICAMFVESAFVLTLVQGKHLMANFCYSIVQMTHKNTVLREALSQVRNLLQKPIA